MVGGGSPVISCQMSSPSHAIPFKSLSRRGKASLSSSCTGPWPQGRSEHSSRQAALEALTDLGTSGEAGADLHSVRRWLTGPQLISTTVRLLEIWVLFGEGSVLSPLPSASRALSTTPRPPRSQVVSPGQVMALWPPSPQALGDPCCSLTSDLGIKTVH